MGETLLSRMMDGSWDPIPSRVFDGLESCSEALQTLRKADHIGKIVVKVPSNLQVREGETYLITGGTGALGLALSRALLEEGVDATRHDRCVPEHHSAHSYVEKAVAFCKDLVLLSRSGTARSMPVWLARSAVRVSFWACHSATNRVFSQGWSEGKALCSDKATSARPTPTRSCYRRMDGAPLPVCSIFQD